MKRVLTILVLLTVLSLTLSACQLYTYDYKSDVREYALITDSGDLSMLDEYPNLEYVDLRGSTCYDAILTYIETHPDVTVRYNVSIGTNRFELSEAQINIDCNQVDYNQLLESLKYLPNLQSVSLNHVSFTGEQLQALFAEYPHVSFSYAVNLCGRRYEHTVTELNLSYLTAADLDYAIRVIALLPHLQQVDLITGIGETNLTIADVQKLNDSCPNVIFNYEFNLHGQHVSTLDTVLSFDSVNIGNEGVESIREALGIMKLCTSVRLDSCGIDDEVMIALRDEFPEKNVAWRIYAGRFSMMTDEEMLRMSYSLTNSEAAVLKYCTKVKYLDVQASKITNIDFIAYMPELECAVLTLAQIADLEPLANCPNLTWLEISNCYSINDLTPLAGLRNLKYLNISCTTVRDLDALDEVPLERFNCVKSYVGGAALQSFIDKHPDCKTVSKGDTLGYGWRYENKRLTQPFHYYAEMEEIFRYRDRTYTGNCKED